MARYLKLLRFALCVAACGIYVLGSTAVRASAPLPSCSETCDEETSCATECEAPVGETTWFTNCGEYSEGSCGDSCQNVCTPWSGSGDECWDAGETDCGSYDVFAHCGDDFCNVGGGEDYGNCSSDCPTPSSTLGTSDPEQVTQGDLDALQEMNDEIDGAGGWGGESMANAQIIADYAYAYGFITAAEDPYIDFEFDESPVPAVEDPDGMPLHGPCVAGVVAGVPVPCATAAKADAVQGISKGIAAVGVMNGLAAVAMGSGPYAVAALACPPCAVTVGAIALGAGAVATFVAVGGWLWRAFHPCPLAPEQDDYRLASDAPTAYYGLGQFAPQ